MELTEFGIRIGAATVGGLLIGAEREWVGKDAGLKTNALVSLGACVFIIISLQFRGETDVDITRVLGQIVTGIGFIGAGTILQRKNKVEGLTSAATIWCSAGAGCLAALTMYQELALLSLLIVIINYLFGFIQVKLLNHRKKKEKEKRS